MAKHSAIGKPANAAEKWAFNYLLSNLPDSYHLITNVDLYDDRGHPFEVDAVLITDYAIHLIDVKGYQDNLEISKDVWMFNGHSVENPLPKLNNNARILASRCRKIITHGQYAPWCQAAVFVTGGEGGKVNIKNSGIDDLPVFDRETIVSALISPDFITCYKPRKLESYQKEIALKALCDFHLLDAKQQSLAGYCKKSLISKVGRVETWIVKPLDKSLNFEYWMKTVDLTSCSTDETTQCRTEFKREYVLLNQLSMIPEVPSPLVYWDDGEHLALVHSCIAGDRLINTFVDSEVVFNVVYSLALALDKVAGEGLTIRTLNAENIYVTSSGNLAFSNILELFTDDSTITLSKQFAAIFKPYFFDCEGDDLFVPSPLLDKHEDLSKWFQCVLEISDVDEQLSFGDLLDFFSSGEAQGLKVVFDVDNLKTGDTVANKYLLERCLGRGATSIVWLAKHLLGDYRCSMKVLKDIDGAIDFAKREFDVLRSSFHPNIVRIFDLDRLPNSETYFLIGQYLDGPTLNELEIDSRLWTYFKEILSALQYLHRINVLHKDIKPQNIVVEADKAFLIDFNLSSVESLLIGTLSYKDPLVKHKGWSKFSDIYSLVVSFVEIATGRHPYSENNDMPTQDINISLPVLIPGLNAKTKNRLQQVLNHEVDFENVPDYLAWFGLTETIDIQISMETKIKWGIREGYMTKTLISLLADNQPRSRGVIISNTLRANGIVGNKSARGSINAAISGLKKIGIVEEHGKKIRLVPDFKLD